MKQTHSKVMEFTRYATWIANIFPIPKEDENIRSCVDNRDLNKSIPKDNVLLPNTHILIKSYTKH